MKEALEVATATAAAWKSEHLINFTLNKHEVLCAVWMRDVLSQIHWTSTECLNYSPPALNATKKRGNLCYCEKEEVEMRKIMNAYRDTFFD